MKKIAVIGSVNMDLFLESSRIPEEGETLQGERFFTAFGGKGANQAIAASKLGGDVTFFGAVGNDPYGDALIDNFKIHGVSTERVQHSEKETGIAFVQLTEGANRITIVSGANRDVQAPSKEVLKAFDMIVLQLEIPLDVVTTMIHRAYELQKTIILDPAPAQALDRTLLEKVTYLLPNEVEYKELLQTEEAFDVAAGRYREKLIITRGSKGVSYTDRKGTFHTIPPHRVQVEDTTGAGDTFAGAFAVALAEEKPLEEALRFANRAASLATTKKGAQTGMPTREEMER